MQRSHEPNGGDRKVAISYREILNYNYLPDGEIDRTKIITCISDGFFSFFD